ncbi:hypothetical protein CG710_009695 [Lachnotalea glycerini]|uniref:Uncharacterized protein n=1 Tax=Lachnotalea glycerini TaxID=1763509 RepID=A0A371JF63_9FIRM|nr:hypothetical protein CG710_009695 [Lachnotalea glycerini]
MVVSSVLDSLSRLRETYSLFAESSLSSSGSGKSKSSSSKSSSKSSKSSSQSSASFLRLKYAIPAAIAAPEIAAKANSLLNFLFAINSSFHKLIINYCKLF